MYIGLGEYPLFLFSFNIAGYFLHRFSKNKQISHFIKIRPVGVKLFHADGQADRHDEANIQFRNFAKTPKNEMCLMI
jgi:hypothetical protein